MADSSKSRPSMSHRRSDFGVRRPAAVKPMFRSAKSSCDSARHCKIVKLHLTRVSAACAKVRPSKPSWQRGPRAIIRWFPCSNPGGSGGTAHGRYPCVDKSFTRGKSGASRGEVVQLSAKCAKSRDRSHRADFPQWAPQSALARRLSFPSRPVE
jgi:hypothetical protein